MVQITSLQYAKKRASRPATYDMYSTYDLSSNTIWSSLNILCDQDFSIYIWKASRSGPLAGRQRDMCESCYRWRCSNQSAIASLLATRPLQPGARAASFIWRCQVRHLFSLPWHSSGTGSTRIFFDERRQVSDLEFRLLT